MPESGTSGSNGGPGRASAQVYPTRGRLRKTRYRALEKVDYAGYLVGAAYNLVRLARMLATTPV